LLVLVAVAMLVEARVSRAHARALRRAGALEPAGDAYAVMQVVYPGCFLAMAAEAWWRGGPGRLMAAGWILFAIAKWLKWWAMRSLGVRWTFRVLVPPGAPLVRRGPYRLLRHPNYVAVVGELGGAALALDAPWSGTLACIGFGLLLVWRIRVEEAALLYFARQPPDA
jgi:methyltransferase